jgi:4'-phosphopantetheinyl transferase EntD
MTGFANQAGSVMHILEQWFPSHAFIEAAAIGDYPILPGESALVANAVLSRRQEFATGRWLARQALRKLGLPDHPIPTGRLKNPLWPPGIIGTISHDGALCAVAVMQANGSIGGIGIDLMWLPRHAGRMNDLLPMFMTDPDELQVVARLDSAAEPAMLLFSLKEALLKALSFRLTDFIDLRSIEIGQPGCSVFGDPIRTILFAATIGDYLVTAAIADG